MRLAYLQRGELHSTVQ